MQAVKDMKSPPIVGQAYLVECIYGTLSNIGPHFIPAQWWPVFTPSHQDSIYAARTRTIWKETDSGYVGVDETYYEDDPETPHHYHVDPRFAPNSHYTGHEIVTRSFHSTIRPEGQVEVKEIICVRPMPIQVLFTGFGKNFLSDHKEKKIRCWRCPHKGTPLGSMPVENGKVTCPAHGLQFDCKTKKCISEWPGGA